MTTVEVLLGSQMPKVKYILLFGGTIEGNIQLDWSAIVKEAIKRRKQSRLTQPPAPCFCRYQAKNLNVLLIIDN